MSISLVDVKQKVISDFSDQPNYVFKKNFSFIDLFAGIGGFHIAAEELGGKCVFSSEWDEDAREVYKNNFYKRNKALFDSGNFAGDITKVDVEQIPQFDFLFAGFPCQPFSKGGHRKGFDDIRGTSFFDIARIVDHHKPKFLLLENVSNILTHDKGETFKKIIETLDNLGYALNEKPLILSPDNFGIPAIRARLYIPAIRKDLINARSFKLNFSGDFQVGGGINTIIDEEKKDEKYYISQYEKDVLDMWNEFYKNIDIKIIGFPIWVDYFKDKKKIDHLPFWKKDFINKNKKLYKRNKKFIDKWLKKYNNLNWVNVTHKKMEWQAGTDINNIYEGLIQFRPSGVRVKRANKFSTLVAMNHAQIIGKYQRRLTPNETKRLQSFPEYFKVHPNDKVALKQLGNAVNVNVLKIILNKILNKKYEER
ncbi:TPA: DNA (cytosine-5-)-methyltransferase [Candidatus Nomurabacteria bacterium]|uniref:Cytosine-specific methyltransferase n=1 Tax=Candidatus Nomurabacteria bacterium GW2011_GWF2_43_24 TaxID=1618778 RepID=A0A0G1HKF1_9BACT|nr:MAG: Cytosine-specific methyltransferase [Parcubacteria group bacterium GW2011_GWC1_42_21]KKS58643.1 MAG: Cytosine-specific methyltransferase [Candidatus Nomurabacteria bacterium GW2011_GWF1_42_40]KKT00406.1 MAG: Cytosine-specific methyltransferase [Candidatus Nomurabacteria bacterium GW2011_GWA1_43_17]KKT07548.1 MAG: Cytosine-specific methyltransferase [Candidatus Nomurabacteria bacterium GW2011_GWB1_43_19]KKT11359.1 MAG: Cytosine-specific methyltransferase [Candidatus Nomurabacteria bacter